MTVYVDLVMGLNFVIDFLLLYGACRIWGSPCTVGRLAAAAALGGLYGGLCLLPGLGFLGNLLWRTVSLGAMASIAFGWNWDALRKGILFSLLTVALGGIAQGMGGYGMGGLLTALGILAVMCLAGFSGWQRGGRQARVMLRMGRQKLHLTALRDTGNTLKDPITGQSVLVIGSEAAQRLYGLTQEQLSDPVGTMASCPVPGLRLIPYRAVGCAGGMLLAGRLDEVEIDGKAAGRLVAFAPQEIGSPENYQALAGGVI